MQINDGDKAKRFSRNTGNVHKRPFKFIISINPRPAGGGCLNTVPDKIERQNIG